MTHMALVAALALLQDPPLEKVKPETVLDCIRRVGREVESFRLRAARRVRGAETWIDYRRGEALIVQTIGHSNRMGFSMDVLVLTKQGLSYRVLRMGANGRILYGRSPFPQPRELYALSVGRNPEYVLLGAALMPEPFIASAREIVRVNEGDRDIFSVTGPALLISGQSVTPVLFVDAATGRLVRYVEQYDRYDFIHSVEAHERGLPSKTTSLYSVQGSAPQPGFEAEWSKDPPEDIPAWAKRDDLPALEGKGPLSAALAAVIPESRNAVDRDALARAKEGLKGLQDPIAQEMLLGLRLLAGDRGEFEEQIQASVESGRADPALAIGAALKLEQEGSAEAALKTLRGVDAAGALGKIRNRTILRLTFAAAATPEALTAEVGRAAEKLGTIEAADVLEPFAIVRGGTIEQEPTHISSRSREFIEGLKPLAKNSESLAIGLARHYARTNEGEEAVRRYSELLDDAVLAPKLRPEIESVARSLAGAEKLADRLVAAGSNDPAILAIHAMGRLSARDITGGLQVARRILEGGLDGDLTRLAALADMVFDTGDARTAESIFRAHLKSVTYLNAEQIRIAKKVVGSDKEKLFEILLTAPPRIPAIYVFNQVGINYRESANLIVRRDGAGTAGERDYLLAAELVRMRQTIPEFGKALSGAAERFPDVIEIQEAAGDWQALASRWPEASERFVHAARLWLEGKRPRVSRSASVSAIVENRTFQPADPLAIKIAYVFGKREDADGGLRWVEALLPRSGRAADQAALAFHLLGAADRAVDAYKRVFYREMDRLHANDPGRLAAGFLLLLEKLGRFDEGYFACEHIVKVYMPKKAGLQWSILQTPDLGKIRERLQDKMGPDPFVHVALEMPHERLTQSEEETVRRLARDLSSEFPEDRQAAQERLRGMGPGIAYLLRGYVEDGDPEVRSRVRELLSIWGEQELRRRFED
jgi:hypothetical protein